MALNLDQIRQAAERVAASHGLEIPEIEYLGGSKHRVLRVFIEKNREERARLAKEAFAAAASAGQTAPSDPAQGIPAGSYGIPLEQAAWITHEDCERFSSDFGALLDVENLVPGSDYTLEVSSPGLDRKLTERVDFERFCKSLVKVQTIAPVAGNRHWQGRLLEVKAEGIVLDLSAARQKSRTKGKAAEEKLEIDFANIQKANLVPEI
ncbi:MAG TPA: ribosome maturation factor RimP [Acidobacteriaceae bacterium]|nr:ribosome maturation factor RimP [Acidobacteriaceae bacterium]